MFSSTLSVHCSNLCYAGHRTKEAFLPPGHHQDNTRGVLQAEARPEHCSKASESLLLFTGLGHGSRRTRASTCHGGNGSSCGKSATTFLCPAHNTHQVLASLDETVTGLDFNADTYEDAYDTFISFLEEIRKQKLAAYHRLMSDLFKLVSYVLTVIGRICANNFKSGAKTHALATSHRMLCGC